MTCDKSCPVSVSSLCAPCLDTLEIKNVVLMGININTCVLNNSFTAFKFDYRFAVLSDCAASMYGGDLHVPERQNIARCLGWVVTNEQFFEKLNAGAVAGQPGHTARVSA